MKLFTNQTITVVELENLVVLRFTYFTEMISQI